MTGRSGHMSCEEFSATMAQMIASGEDIFAHPHVKTCKVHKALLEDLETIARAARQLFPDVDPSERIWEKIKAGLDRDSHVVEKVSEPFPGCRLVVRTRVLDRGMPKGSPVAYDRSIDERNHPGTAPRSKAGRPIFPPRHKDGRQ